MPILDRPDLRLVAIRSITITESPIVQNLGDVPHIIADGIGASSDGRVSQIERASPAFSLSSEADPMADGDAKYPR